MRDLAVPICAIALALAGCSKSAGEEVAKGQVVATVGNKEITVHELNAELAGLNLPADEKSRDGARNAALEALIGRTILTNIARERKIDQTPAYQIQRRRADEALLAQMLQRDIAANVEPPSREEAVRFINANPDLFAQRKVYQLDQIQFKTPSDAAFVRSLEPLTSMEQVEQKLIEGRVEYRRAPGVLDTVGVNLDAIRKISSLPKGEIFILPTGPTVVANVITSTQVVPFVGDQAVDYAMTVLQNRTVAAKLQTELKARVDTARKAVRYQPGFGPGSTTSAAAAGKTKT